MARASSTWLADALLLGVGTSVESQATRAEGAATRGAVKPDHLADEHGQRRCRAAPRATRASALILHLFVMETERARTTSSHPERLRTLIATASSSVDAPLEALADAFG